MTDNIKISVKSLYKIFGTKPQSVLQAVKDGMGKPELMEKHNHVLALQDINIDMTDGEITVIMGLSGSGKSTIIRHLNRLIDPTAGEVIVDGIDVLKLSDDELRSMRQTKMSMVFQKFALLPHKTVLENAGTPLRIRGIGDEDSINAEAQKWIDRVGLTGNENQYPHQLSGGMQQRVGIARALTSNSEVMLMDEAFSALDPLIRTVMQDLLLELQEDLHKTIVFITHDLDEALKLADHLVILKDGAIIQQGEPQDILLNPNDPYIEDFVSDINRARVLKVRSIMSEVEHDLPSNEDNCCDFDDTLEDVIAHSEGEILKSYVVMNNGEPVGALHMKDLVKALVPRLSSEPSAKAS